MRGLHLRAALIRMVTQWKQKNVQNAVKRKRRTAFLKINIGVKRVVLSAKENTAKLIQRNAMSAKENITKLI